MYKITTYLILLFVLDGVKTVLQCVIHKDFNIFVLKTIFIFEFWQ